MLRKVHAAKLLLKAAKDQCLQTKEAFGSALQKAHSTTKKDFELKKVALLDTVTKGKLLVWMNGTPFIIHPL